MISAFAVVVVRLRAGDVLVPNWPPPSTSRGVDVSTPDAVTIAQDASDEGESASVTVQAPEALAIAQATQARPRLAPVKSNELTVHDPLEHVDVNDCVTASSNVSPPAIRSCRVVTEPG